jgi:DNA repair exonuclease SbcCD ATPase subunit
MSDAAGDMDAAEGLYWKKRAEHAEAAVKGKEAEREWAQKNYDECFARERDLTARLARAEEAREQWKETASVRIGQVDGYRVRLAAAEDMVRRKDAFLTDAAADREQLRKERDTLKAERDRVIAQYETQVREYNDEWRKLKAAVEQARLSSEKLRHVLVNDGHTWESNPSFEKNLEAVADELSAALTSAGEAT